MRRAAIVIGCLVVAVGGFFVARGSGGDAGTSSQPAAGTTATSGAAATTSTAKAPTPQATAVAIRARGGQPVGGPKTISVKKGRHVTISVVSDTADEAHLHGYDVEKELVPGKPVAFDLRRANLEGIYELELHHSGAVLAKLQVNP